MSTDAKATCKRHDALKSEASTHWKHCEEMTEFMAPTRSGIISKRSPGQRQNRTTFDSTATAAGELFANFIASYTINPSQQWGGMRGKDLQDDEMQEIGRAHV